MPGSVGGGSRSGLPPAQAEGSPPEQGAAPWLEARQAELPCLLEGWLLPRSGALPHHHACCSCSAQMWTCTQSSQVTHPGSDRRRGTCLVGLLQIS